MSIKLKLTLLIMVVLTITGIILYYKYPFWNQYKTDNFLALIAFQGTHIKGNHGKQVLIHKGFEKYMKEIDNLAEICDVEIYVTQGYRDDEKPLSNTIVEPAKYSNHNAGHAIDFNIKYKGQLYRSNQLFKSKLKNQPQAVQNFIQYIRNHPKLRWGGDFTIEDPVHIDLPLNILDKEKWITCEKECALDYARKIPKWQFWS